ncbi:histidine kinase [Breznakia blatticola]|uniref:Histidine kinase n=1 Tax=Breznakia blatticola TaxID=1754012 RepID=A0A4R8AA82_9FIRM|nr:histidine kinase [Breznakia blatticola]TDW25310.1 histidine kinase [Breznakia blatticola]
MAGSKFKERLLRSSLLKIIRLLVIVSIVFAVGFLGVTMAKNEFKADHNLDMMRDFFQSNYDNAKEFLTNDAQQEIFREILEDETSQIVLEGKLNQYNNKNDLTAKAILFDVHGEVKYSTYSEHELSRALLSHSILVSNNARGLKTEDVYTSTYFKQARGFSDYIMMKEIADEQGQTLGFMTLYLSGEDWSYYMSFYNCDGVITDSNDIVIFFNEPKVLQNDYYFYTNDKSVKIRDDRYWVIKKYSQKYDVNFYSMVFNPTSYEIPFALMMVAIIGILWYRAIKDMANTMADKNSKSISLLASEIDIIKDENPEHRIAISTQDEFEAVANQINTLLDRVQELHNENTQLLELNNMVEMKQLTAQFNPHFLYNTLEILRNLWAVDKERADRLIYQLTQVLRYSINNAKRDVQLAEDMIYINHYLEIQKLRYGDRFECSIDIEDNCYTCVIPKLLLQPMIENSIKYGYLKVKKLKIQIRAYMNDNVLYIMIKDNGHGMEHDRELEMQEYIKGTQEAEESFGLYNVARRLELQYAGVSGIELVNEQGIGLEVWIKIEQSKLG